MKKTVILCVGIMLVASLCAFSQTEPSSPTAPTSAASSSTLPDPFVKTVPIVKIYVNNLGYKVLYLKSNMEVGIFYVPVTWFGKKTGKGMMVWEPGGQPSYFSVFWLDGKFDHVVIHVPANMQSVIWGVLENSADLSAKFNIEEPSLSF
jgi:hypothetical protein